MNKLKVLAKTVVSLTRRHSLFNLEKSRLNLCLLFGIIISALYLSISPFYRYHLPESKTGATLETMNKSAIHQGIPFPVYQQLFNEKNIFGAPFEKVVVEPKRINASQILNKLSLIGIISVDGKCQALILDKEKKEEYFCTGGETIRAFTVERVLRDRVVLKSEDQELELMP